MKLKQKLKDLFKSKKKIDLSRWEDERAVLETLGDIDRKWVEMRYELARKEIQPNDIVLDAACGSGFGSKILSQKAATVYGVDLCNEAVDYAKEKYGNKRLVFKEGDVRKLPFKNSNFDVAVGIETLEHVVDYNSYLQELKRVVKKDGKIIVSTPQKKSDIPQTKFHVKEFYYEEFINALQQYFIVSKVFGLKRGHKHNYQKVGFDNYVDYDIYLAVCEQKDNDTKIVYDEKYYKDEEEGYKNNYCGRIFAKELANRCYGECLSIGCATGIVEAEIKRYAKTVRGIIGTDIFDNTYMKNIRKQHKGLDDFIVVDKSTSYMQPFADESFDTVYTSHVLEHIPFPEKMIEESIRLTKNVAMHLVPVNLRNPGHINFFRWDKYDNPYRLQEATHDLKQLADKIIHDYKIRYPKLRYELSVICSRKDITDVDLLKKFTIKKEDRPDGLLESFLLVFYKK